MHFFLVPASQSEVVKGVWFSDSTEPRCRLNRDSWLLGWRQRRSDDGFWLTVCEDDVCGGTRTEPDWHGALIGCEVNAPSCSQSLIRSQPPHPVQQVLQSTAISPSAGRNPKWQSQTTADRQASWDVQRTINKLWLNLRPFCLCFWPTLSPHRAHSPAGQHADRALSHRAVLKSEWHPEGLTCFSGDRPETAM